MKYAGSQFRGHSENRSFVPAPSGSGQTTLRAPEKSPGGPLRILWVKVGGLWPVNTGGRLRSFHLISELSRHHQVTVLTTHHPEEGRDGLARHLPRCENVVSVPHAPVKRNSLQFLWALVRSWPTALPVDLHKSRIEKLAQRVQRELSSGKFDLCVADFLFAVPNMPAAGTTPIVFFAHNVEYMIWKRLCENGMGALRSGLLQIEWRKMRRYEHQACARADLTIAVSEEDQRLLRQGMSEGMFEGMSDWFHDHLEPGDIVVRLGAPPAGGGRGPAGDGPRTAVTTLLCDPAVRRPDIAVLATAADLIRRSVAIDAAMLTAATGARAPGLPTYPFERERYWFDDG
jgi:hypothetical protein